MYKVLLADDEVLDLEGMRKFIPWQEMGLEVVEAVNNGFAACEVIEREHIDILVTDIRMPNMSGLELAKKALEKQENLRIIFVSGHQDFNYVKQAISLNAHGYVLKPMDDKELIESLNKLCLDLNRKKKVRDTEEAYKQMVPIVKNEYLMQLLDGPSDSNASEWLEKEYQLDSLDWPARVALVEIDDYFWKLNPYEDDKRKKMLSWYYEELAESFKRNGIAHVCRITKQRTALLLDGNVALHALNEVVADIKTMFPFTITIGLGGAVDGLSEIYVSYGQAVEAIDSKMFRGKGKLIRYDKVGSHEIQDIKSLDERLEAMLIAMSNYDLVRIHDELSGLFQITSRMGSRITIHNFAMYLVMKLNDYLRANNEDLFKLLGMELKNLDILLQFETIDDIHKWLRYRVFEISEMLNSKKHTKNGKLIQAIIASVSDRLQDNITLREVADQFSFSPNYLGVLFKEETGQNFSDYIIALRMEKAQRLLKSSKLKIYEVADRVGYRYLPYFSRQFRETIGMTPLEYRRKS
ncbi:response regulator [Cohnella cholangitidis]|uniref:Response regulator n=1 Tax=Cohnella cholangitidis TaxID=2598458 RepID=A0A7G5C2T0_9BACL|nr:response regulator [Cohnella cholangitidis]QMV43514.1 response regulator [Cohnella cholangitidis]